MGNLQSSNFITDHSIDNTLHPVYARHVNNTLTGTEFTIPTASEPAGAGSRVALIEDVPDFLQITPDLHGRQLKIVPQYKGYLVNLSSYNSIDNYLLEVFSKNSRKNVRAKLRKLEYEYNIRYAFYHGTIDRAHYDMLFETCYALMKERFGQKEIFNRYLLEWDYYHRLFYPMILSGEASIFVIYDLEKPITLTLNFHRADMVYSFIQIFDVDYSTYSMGDIAMYRNLEWCLSNSVSLWDTSKGATDNKERWCNHVYRFNHHLIYDPQKPLQVVVVQLLSAGLHLKQWLRDKGVIGGRFQWDALNFYLRKGQIRKKKWKAR